MFIKFCGFTREQDVLAAMALPVSAIGFVFHRASARYVSPIKAMHLARHVQNPGPAKVGIFTGTDPAAISAIAGMAGLDYLQLYDPAVSRELEGFRPQIRAYRIGARKDLAGIPHPGDGNLLLLDSSVPGMIGGTGERFNWEYLRDFPYLDRTIIAGGINESNAAELLSVVRPFGIDISSGIETSPGIKSAHKMSAIIRIISEVIDHEKIAR